MIAQETIAEILERASLVEIIGEVVPLKRAGTNFVGLCPFHSEKSPSFNVRENDGYFHCFGCGESGNVFKFVMEIRGLSFPEAVEELAARYGVKVKLEGGKTKIAPRSDKDFLYRANSIAAEFFFNSLKNSSKLVTDYVLSRGITPRDISAFKLGFAPDSWNALAEYLRSKKVPDEIALASGLIKRNDKGDFYDHFRGRLIFPVWLDQTKIAGFGGRVIPPIFDETAASKMPKYLNSPETPVYQKSKILYGLPQALPLIRQSSTIYVVEGYMDVLSLHRVGVTNSVATCGTALTDLHVKKLAQLASKIVVLFDGDDAGRNAAGKSFATFLNSGVDVSALFLSSEDDPDSVSVRLGKETQKYLNGLVVRSLLDCYIDSLLERYGTKELSEVGSALKGTISKDLAKTISQVKNAVELDEYIERTSLRLRIDNKTLRNLVESERQGTKGEIVNKVEKAEDDSSEPAEHSGQTKSINDLPLLDREILLAVMAKKEFLPSQLLKDSDVALGIDQATLAFVQGLASISASKNEENEKKEGIKRLLNDFGPTWLSHWKKAYSMIQDKAVDLIQVYEECRLKIKKDKLIQLVKEIDREFALSQDEDKRLYLSQEKIALSRLLDSHDGLKRYNSA